MFISCGNRLPFATWSKWSARSMTRSEHCNCRCNHRRRSKYRLHRPTCHRAWHRVCHRRIVAPRRVCCHPSLSRLLIRTCNTHSRISTFPRLPTSAPAQLGHSTVLARSRHYFHNSCRLSPPNNSHSRVFCSSSHPRAGNPVPGLLRVRLRSPSRRHSSNNTTSLRLPHNRSRRMRSNRTSHSSSRRRHHSKWPLHRVRQSPVV